MSYEEYEKIEKNKKVKKDDNIVETSCEEKECHSSCSSKGACSEKKECGTEVEMDKNKIWVLTEKAFQIDAEREYFKKIK